MGELGNLARKGALWLVPGGEGAERQFIAAGELVAYSCTADEHFGIATTVRVIVRTVYGDQLGEFPAGAGTLHWVADGEVAL